MAVPIELQNIPGAMQLDSWFGCWPSFHDAEIISLHLNRNGNSFLRVHTWEMTKEVDDNITVWTSMSWSSLFLRKYLTSRWVVSTTKMSSSGLALRKLTRAFD